MKKAEDEFKAALASDPGNDHAHLGLGLIEMQRSRDAAEAKLSAYTVGQHFITGILELHQARHTNDYIKGLLNSKAWGELLTNSAGYRDLDLSPEFLGSADKYREARRAMVKCQYGKVVNLIKEVKAPPNWIKGHLQLLRDMAELRLTDDRNKALDILAKFEKQKEEFPKEIWMPIFGIAAAEWAKDDQHWRSKARDALNQSIKLAREREPLLAAKANRARGFIMLGNVEDAYQQLFQVETTISTFEEQNDAMDLREIGFTLAMAYTALGDYQRTASWLERVIQSDNIYIDAVRNSPYLKSFREEWGGYHVWSMQYLP